VDLEGTLDIRAALSVHLVFGVDANGFFIDPNSSPDPEVTVSNFQIGGKVQGSGRFGFLEVKLTNATLNVDPQVKVAINLHDPGTGGADGRSRLDEVGAPIAKLASAQLQGNPSADDVALTGAFTVAALIPGQDAPFSLFPGVDRELVLLSGNGLRLRFDDGDVNELHPPHDRMRFAGESAVTGELLDGPTQDFNLMWRRDAIDAQLWHRPLVGPMVIFAEPHTTWAVHLLAGSARFADDSGLPPLATGDTAILQAGDERLRHVIEGGGELLLVRVNRHGAPGAMD
jgi:hypothetical protein